MTSAQLKEVISISNKLGLAIRHERVAYFEHVVFIGRKKYDDILKFKRFIKRLSATEKFKS